MLPFNDSFVEAIFDGVSETTAPGQIGKVELLESSPGGHFSSQILIHGLDRLIFRLSKI
jgi:hypothetical protein